MAEVCAGRRSSWSCIGCKTFQLQVSAVTFNLRTSTFTEPQKTSAYFSLIRCLLAWRTSQQLFSIWHDKLQDTTQYNTSKLVLTTTEYQASLQQIQYRVYKKRRYKNTAEGHRYWRSHLQWKAEISGSQSSRLWRCCVLGSLAMQSRRTDRRCRGADASHVSKFNSGKHNHNGKTFTFAVN